MEYRTQFKTTPAPTGAALRKKRNLLIYPKFQLTLLAVQTGVLLLTLGMVALQSWRSVDHLRQLGESAALAPTHPYFRFLDMHAQSLLSFLGVAFVVAVIVTSLISLVLSHRLAGPIIRLRGYFRELSETGKITHELKFRQGDFFAEVPELVNQALKKVKLAAKPKPKPY